MSDVLSGIVHRDLLSREKDAIRKAVATANLTVESIARRPGMEWDKRDDYRKHILGLRVSLTKHEVTVLKGINPAERDAIRGAEAVKYRLLEGHAKMLAKLVSNKLTLATWFTSEKRRVVREDLSGEALTAFCHAFYRFNRYDIQFGTFLTTVVNNWLLDYCSRLSRIKMTEQMRDDIFLYYGVRDAERKADRTIDFEGTVRIIVLNELRDKGVAATERNVQEYTELNADRFRELRQTTRRFVQVDETCVSAAPAADFDSLLQDVLEGVSLTPLERQAVEFRLDGKGIKELTEEAGVLPYHAKRAFSEAMGKIEACLEGV